MNASMNDRKKAVLLTTALLVIAVLCVVRIYVVSHSSVENGQALYADLYQNGELLQTIRLDTVTAEYTFEVSGSERCLEHCLRPSGQHRYDLCQLSGSDLCASGIYQHLPAPHHLSAQSAGDPGQRRGFRSG